MSGDGMTMGSEVGGGLSAVMAVVAVGAAPKLSFSALQVVGPTGSAGAPDASLALSSLSGARIPYTPTAFAITSGVLIDTLTLNAKIVNPSGFKAGNYTASSTATCEAP
jgi:hypothetical protein